MSSTETPMKQPTMSISVVEIVPPLSAMPVTLKVPSETVNPDIVTESPLGIAIRSPLVKLAGAWIVVTPAPAPSSVRLSAMVTCSV